MVYTIASPDEYLAITGAGIKTLKIVKSAWVWPFQRVSTFRTYPVDLEH
jgi:flotillin